jgi:hypothetical protein
MAEETVMDLFTEMLKPKQKVAEYLDAPDVQAIAIKLIADLNMVEARDARIKYLFKISDKPQKFAGRCHKADKKWKHLTGIDFVIEVWDSWWAAASPVSREALVYHELLHIGKGETRTGKVKWFNVEHPVEAFYEEVRRYGPWSPQLREVNNILLTADQVKQDALITPETLRVFPEIEGEEGA